MGTPPLLHPHSKLRIFAEEIVLLSWMVKNVKEIVLLSWIVKNVKEIVLPFWTSEQCFFIRLGKSITAKTVGKHFHTAKWSCESFKLCFRTCQWVIWWGKTSVGDGSQIYFFDYCS